MRACNGYRSWNGWNVALWINNDEYLYALAQELYHAKLRDCNVADLARRRAARKFVKVVGEKRTPDGAVYNELSVYNAMEGMNQ